MQTWPGLRAQEHGAAAAQILLSRHDLMEAREHSAGMSCFSLTQPSIDKPVWGCRRHCYTPQPELAQKQDCCSSGALQAYCQPEDRAGTPPSHAHARRNAIRLQALLLSPLQQTDRIECKLQESLFHTGLPCCLGFTLLAGDGDLKDTARMEDVPGEPLSFATRKDPWRTSALDLHRVSIERLFCSSPVQSAAAIRLYIVKLQLLLLSFLLTAQSHHLREDVMADATSANVMRKRQTSRELV